MTDEEVKTFLDKLTYYGTKLAKLNIPKNPLTPNAQGGVLKKPKH